MWLLAGYLEGDKFAREIHALVQEINPTIRGDVIEGEYGTPVLTTLGYVYTFKPVSGFANDQSFPNSSTDAGARD